MTRVADGGHERQVSKQRALVKALVDAAIAGDLRAATAVISLTAKVVGHDLEEEDGDAPPSAHDHNELIESFLEREVARRSSDHSANADSTEESRESEEKQ
jgi:hypothetical protein